MNFLKEHEGKFSGKRIAGFIGLFSLIGIAIFAIIQDASQAANVMWPVASVTLACFGATAIKDLGGKK